MESKTITRTLLKQIFRLHRHLPTNKWLKELLYYVTGWLLVTLYEKRNILGKNIWEKATTVSLQ